MVQLMEPLASDSLNAGTSRRVLIVGGVAGGASCAARLGRLDESVEIRMFDRGPYVSFTLAERDCQLRAAVLRRQCYF
jgi:hypothetical protein